MDVVQCLSIAYVMSFFMEGGVGKLILILIICLLQRLSKARARDKALAKDEMPSILLLAQFYTNI